MTERIAQVTRNTRETRIDVTVNLDGTGACQFDTGVPFLEHMMEQIARHGVVDLDIKANGDLHIDDHHTVALVHEFFQGFCNHALATVHVDNLRGENSHHIAETVFKAFGRALRHAVKRDSRVLGVPSTKGVL